MLWVVFDRVQDRLYRFKKTTRGVDGTEMRDATYARIARDGEDSEEVDADTLFGLTPPTSGRSLDAQPQGDVRRRSIGNDQTDIRRRSLGNDIPDV